MERMSSVFNLDDGTEIIIRNAPGDFVADLADWLCTDHGDPDDENSLAHYEQICAEGDTALKDFGDSLAEFLKKFPADTQSKVRIDAYERQPNDAPRIPRHDGKDRGDGVQAPEGKVADGGAAAAQRSAYPGPSYKPTVKLTLPLKALGIDATGWFVAEDVALGMLPRVLDQYAATVEAFGTGKTSNDKLGTIALARKVKERIDWEERTRGQPFHTLYGDVRERPRELARTLGVTEEEVMEVLQSEYPLNESHHPETFLDYKTQCAVRRRLSSAALADKLVKMTEKL
jgi:hypothetical protein